MKKKHILKIEKPFLEALVSGRKTCEIRKNDRDFQTGDLISFDEEILWQGHDCIPSEVVGRVVTFEVTHVLNSSQFEGLKDGFVALSLKKKK